MARNNAGISAGHFSGVKYDDDKYLEDVYDSTSPYSYYINPNYNFNCKGRLNLYGPRGGLMGVGVSSLSGDVLAAGQQNVDMDSIMSNRNVPGSRARQGKVNPVDLSKIRLKDVPICDSGYLDYSHTKMTDPALFMRGCPINRFYDLNKDPQANIYYDWGINTSLDARDNYTIKLPNLSMMDNDTIPTNKRDRQDKQTPRVIEINSNGNCGNLGTGCVRRQ